MNKNISLALFLLITYSASGTSDEHGFSGMWVLDKRSPRPGNAPSSMETRIKLKGSSVTIESTFSEPANGIVPLLYLGVMTTKLSLTMDGREQENSVGPFDIQSKTTFDGKQMLTDWIATILGEQVQGHWTHRLSDDARHLILEIREISAHGQHGEAILYFVRK